MADKDTPIYKRGDAWYVRIPLGNSKYKHRSLGKVSRREAMDAADRMLNTAGGDILFDDAVKRWLTEHVAVMLPKSASTYRFAMISAAPHFEGRQLGDIGAPELAAWESALRADGKARDTIALYFRAMSSLFTWLEHSGAYVPPVNHVAAYIRRSRGRAAPMRIASGEAKTRFLSEDEEIQLLAAMDRAPGNRATWTMVQQATSFAIATGLRVSELLAARRSWVTGDRLRVPSANAKGGKARIVPLLPVAHEVLRATPRAPDADLLFWTVRAGATDQLRHLGDRLDVACALAKIPRASPHDLRRTCGCRLLQGSAMTNGKRLRIEAVSRWLGHSSIAITQKHYAFITPSSLEQEVAEMFAE